MHTNSCDFDNDDNNNNNYYYSASFNSYCVALAVFSFSDQILNLNPNVTRDSNQNMDANETVREKEK